MHPRIEKHIERVKRTLHAFFPVRPGSILQNFDRENPELMIKFDDPHGREPGFVERIQLRRLYGQTDVLYSAYPPNKDSFPNNWDKMIWIDTRDRANPQPNVYSPVVEKYIPMVQYAKVAINEDVFVYDENGKLNLIEVNGGTF